MQRRLGAVHVATRKLTQGDANSLRQLGDVLREKDPAVVAVLALVGEKVTFQAVCGKEAVARGVKAGDLIKTITPICGGRGGGKPDSAMGGGSDLEKGGSGPCPGGGIGSCEGVSLSGGKHREDRCFPSGCQRREHSKVWVRKRMKRGLRWKYIISAVLSGWGIR